MRDVERDRVRRYHLGPQYAPAPRIAKIKLKILRHKRRLPHQPVQQVALRGRPLIQRIDRNEVRLLFSHRGSSQPTGPPWPCQENSEGPAAASALVENQLALEL